MAPSTLPKFLENGVFSLRTAKFDQNGNKEGPSGASDRMTRSGVPLSPGPRLLARSARPG
eukprot:3727898-Rhodomonas_salina.3